MRIAGIRAVWIAPDGRKNMNIQPKLPVLSRVMRAAVITSIEMPFGGQQSGKFGFQIGHPWIETHATCSLFKELPVLSLWHGNCL
jgi:hypothetical protein